MTGTSNRGKAPRWLKAANRPVVALQRLGLAFGPMYLVSIPRRKSGELRTTPVSPVTVDGERYVVAVFEKTDWVENARAAGWAILARRRKREQVTLTELPLEDRAVVLRQLPRKAPQAAQFFWQRYGVENDPKAFTALAPRCPVFHVDFPVENP